MLGGKLQPSIREHGTCKGAPISYYYSGHWHPDMAQLSGRPQHPGQCLQLATWLPPVEHDGLILS